MSDKRKSEWDASVQIQNEAKLPTFKYTPAPPPPPSKNGVNK